MTELSVLGVKKGDENVDILNKHWSLKSSFCP